jgi:hypothetical protein
VRELLRRGAPDIVPAGLAAYKAVDIWHIIKLMSLLYLSEFK